MPRITQVTRLLVFISSAVTILFCASTLWTRAGTRSGLIPIPQDVSANSGDGSDGVTGRRPLTHDPGASESQEYSRLLWNTIKYRPWFLSGGFLRPDHRSDVYSKLSIWPNQDPDSDRIVNQLMYLPSGYNASQVSRNQKIFLFHGRGGWNARDLPMGQKKFLTDSCPVSTCELSIDPKDMPTADLIFFKDRFQWPPHERPAHQIWLLFLLECPSHTQSFVSVNNAINWTASYRYDSDIVAPYEKFFHLNYHSNPTTPSDEPLHESSEAMVTDRFHPLTPTQSGPRNGGRKENKVAWFVSNCGAKNQRLQYAQELGRYIDVDIFGSCGTKRCPRSRQRHCFSLLNTTYKYYLAFENSNCRDYMTEKFFVNGLMNNVLPIVMGAHPDDYRRTAPPNSYIHVDDFASPKHLANFLLNMDDETYHSFFRWKLDGEFINTYFWCRLCALMHSPRAQHESHSYPDLHHWWKTDWNGDQVCNNRGWRKGIPHRFDNELAASAKLEAQVNTSKELLTSQEEDTRET